MKTPMQELIEFIDKEQGMFKDVVVMEIKRKALSLLPKEKQAFIDTYMQGWYDEASGLLFDQAEKYFNEKYGNL